jgi:hypothetical protein
MSKFDTTTKVEVVNGEKCFFRLDKWINSKSVEQLAYQLIHPTAKAKRAVEDAIPEGKWMDDIKKPLTIRAIPSTDVGFNPELGGP